MQRLSKNGKAICVAVTVLLLTIASGCTTTKQTASNTPPPSEPEALSQSSATSQATSSATEAPPKQVEPVEAPAAIESPPVKTAAPTAPKAATQPPTKAQAPTVAKTEKPEGTKAVTPTANTATVAPPVSATPTLDMRSLEQRLRDTRAIGIMTKLSLKNQVDDLLDDFRAYYAGKTKTALTDLRQRYDLLLMKVLSVLQDEDVTLASDISSSREAIWGILRDPKKFAEI
jgi:hypothetical protein